MVWTDAIEPLLDAKDEDVAIVVAHQDDEALLVAMLRRFPRATFVLVTDGAPDDPKEWKGWGTRESYARVRTNELYRSLDAAGHLGTRFEFRIRDSTVTQEYPKFKDTLKRVLRNVPIVCTHAYEGGHPDHDAVAAAVHSLKPRAVIESPFYRMRAGRSVWQCFLPQQGCEVHHVLLSPEQREVKKAMISAYVSQKVAMQNVSLDAEQYRVAPAYDFSRPPNSGNLSRNYARLGISASNWKSFT